VQYLRERGENSWYKQRVLRVLANPVYAGLIRSGADLCPAEHAPIIEREQFERVQVVLERHRTEILTTGKNPAYLLRGVLRCGACGAAMTPAGARRKYRYYRCMTADKQGRGACRARPLPAPAIETFVVDRIRDHVTAPDFVPELTRRLELRLRVERDRLRAERGELPATIARLAGRAREVFDAAEGLRGAARRVADERLTSLGREQEEAERRLSDIERRLAELDALRIEGEWVAQVASNFDRVWEASTPANRQRIVAALVQSVVVDEASGQAALEIAEIGAAA
jgi:hypothetical protein